jgi:hypothetical protein
MTIKIHLRSLLSVGALAVTASTWGCVADRPSRNGVPDENQYIRKDFLVRPGDSTTPDRGWYLAATITEASEPNVYGDPSVYGLFTGAHSMGQIVHFNITSNKLEMVNSREINSTPSVGTQSEVINTWPITNVDLKYQINMDGEKTNFYQENLELDWQLRQWVKVNLDKNDQSDLSPLGSYVNASLAKSAGADVTATLVPNTFTVDEAHDYLSWKTQVVIPINWSDSNCVESYGPMGIAAGKLGREYETVTIMYSMTRAEETPTYQPLVVTEKDPIRRKYGAFAYPSITRDPSTGLLASNEYVVRYDPTKEIKWYFEKGFPDQYKNIFTSKNLPQGVSPLSNVCPDGVSPLPKGCTPTIEQQTNEILSNSGAAARVSFHEYNEPMDDGTPTERQFGDVRYSMLRWIESLDQQNIFAGVTESVIDPRNGRTLSTGIVFENFGIQDAYIERIDAYLQSLGASQGIDSPDLWADPPTIPDPNDSTKTIPVQCDSEGKTVPLVSAKLVGLHNANSTLYGKIQAYLGKPVGTYGALGPADFVKQQDDDFRAAYFAYLPYITYGDPEQNPFVIPEGGQGSTSGSAGSSLNDRMWQMIATERQFHDTAGQIDRGVPPYDITSPTGEQDLLNFANQYRNLSINHRNYRVAKQTMRMTPGSGMAFGGEDLITSFAMESTMLKDARHCIKDSSGMHWETKDQWKQSLIQTYWSQVFWHEFGHSLGLEHNFMASVDQPNFPVATDSAGNAIHNCDKAPTYDGNGKLLDPGDQKSAGACVGTPRYGLYASSVMEYNTQADRVFWQAGWGPYDKGAISWIYGNNGATPAPPQGQTAPGVSGQVSATAPWSDKYGWTTDASGNPKETQFLFCTENHVRYTPLCRPGDLGTTPSEIVANDLDNYEWQYKWRNFRLYRKLWDDSKYADVPMDFVTEQRRFMSLWAYDMGSSELTTAFTRIGIKPPPGAPSAQLYYAQLTEKFTDEMSHAAQMGAAFHEAIIQQSSGQRPYITVYDNYFGDVTQQGITLDKLDALEGFLGMWPVDNYDVNQSAGMYIVWYGPFGLATQTNGTAIGSEYQTVAEQAAASMIGAGYAAFPYFKPLGVGMFTQDTHSVEFSDGTAMAGAIRPEVRDWAGGWVFTRLDDFLAFFHNIATANNFSVPAVGIDCTHANADLCNYDPRTARAYPQDEFYSDQTNQFHGPDGRRYIWAYLQDRNTWVVADRDRHVGTYQIMYTYTSDLITARDDGTAPGVAFNYEYPVKYFIDYFMAASQYQP